MPPSSRSLSSSELSSVPLSSRSRSSSDSLSQPPSSRSMSSPEPSLEMLLLRSPSSPESSSELLFSRSASSPEPSSELLSSRSWSSDSMFDSSMVELFSLPSMFSLLIASFVSSICSIHPAKADVKIMAIISNTLVICIVGGLR